nr:hypothetical protein [Tanacetum cinerariifolium]
EKVNDDDDDEEEVPKIDEQETTESGEGVDEETESDGESEDEETTEKEEESFDPISRTLEESEDDGNDEEDQGVKLLEVNFSNILGIVNQYMHRQMPEAVREVVQTQTDRLQDSIQRENDEFLKTIDDIMKKIIKEQVKTQVKAQVTRILSRIEESVNAQLEAEALVEAYDADKTILDTYGESAILKRRREEDDDQEVPSAGSDWGSKRQREGGEHASASTPSEQATESTGRSTTGTQSRQMSANTPIDFSNFIMNWLGVDTLTPELLAGLTYELMRGSCNSLTELEYHLEEVYKAITNQLDWVNPEVNRKSALDVYSKRRIIAVTELKIVEWHNYKHLDWILVRRDDDKIYKFKEGDLKRLRL